MHGSARGCIQGAGRRCPDLQPSSALPGPPGRSPEAINALNQSLFFYIAKRFPDGISADIHLKAISLSIKRSPGCNLPDLIASLIWVVTCPGRMDRFSFSNIFPMKGVTFYEWLWIGYVIYRYKATPLSIGQPQNMLRCLIRRKHLTLSPWRKARLPS